LKINPKVIFIGGIAMYVSQFLASMLTGPFIHEGVLTPLYIETQAFWRPELNQQPPDMAALLPRWITVGIITTFIIAGIYDNIRPALEGSGLVKGLKFGVIAWLFSLCLSAGWSGVFNLPEMIWVWWNVEFLLMYLLGGAVLGLVAGKLAPE